LTPISCWAIAITSPIATIARTPGASRSRTLPCSFASSVISSSSSSTSPSLDRARRRTSRASSSRPWATSQRGEKGWKYIPIAKTRPGTAPSPSIQRQLPLTPPSAQLTI
jgi:hypothetical protein